MAEEEIGVDFDEEEINPPHLSDDITGKNPKNILHKRPLLNAESLSSKEETSKVHWKSMLGFYHDLGIPKVLPN